MSVDFYGHADAFDKAEQDLHFRSASNLRITQNVVKKILITGSCGASAILSENKPEFEAEYVYFGHNSRLPDRLDDDFSNYDFHVAFPTLRSIMHHRDFTGFPRIPLSNKQEYVEFFDSCCVILEAAVTEQIRYAAEHNLTTFVANFFLPIQNPNGRLLPRYELSNPVYFINKLNEHLAKFISGKENVFFFDFDGICSSLGRLYVQDDVVSWINHGSVLVDISGDTERLEKLGSLSSYYTIRADKLAAVTWIELESMYRTVRQIDPIKMVIVDLDDTLRNGIAGEADYLGPEMVEAAIWPYGVIEALLYLKNRGILLAISSKNSEVFIEKAFSSIVGERIKLSDFAARKIDFRTKAEHISEILSMVNLLPSNVLFIDDNPVERNAVKSAFPAIRTLGSVPFYWRKDLLWSPELQVSYVTAESERRTQMVQNQITRDEDAKAMSRPEFLASLNFNLFPEIVKDSGHAKFKRAVELINKTNQFNTTGRRWSVSEIEDKLSSGMVMITFNATDIYTDYGLIGVVLLSGDSIDQFVMSCRVGGVDADIACIAYVCSLVPDGRVIGQLINTENNAPIKRIFENTGFRLDAHGNWVCDIARPVIPAHIGGLQVNPR